jgi:hypothetical protein
MGQQVGIVPRDHREGLGVLPSRTCDSEVDTLRSRYTTIAASLSGAPSRCRE